MPLVILNESIQESNMRTIRITSWVLVPVVLSAFGVWGLIGYAKEQSELQIRCDRFVNQSILSICQNWDSTELLNRAEPDSRKACDLAAVDRIFRIFAKLGVLKKYYGCQGGVETADGIITFFYIAKADFETGPAVIILQGSQKDGVFYVGDITVKSEVLLKARHEDTES